MRIEIIKQYHNDNLADFEFKVNRYCERLENLNKNIIDIQIIHENSLIAIVKYENIL